MKRAPPIRTAILSFVLIVGIFWFTGQRSVESVSRPQAKASASAAERGAGAFMGASFGGLSMDALSSNAVPWRLAATALVMEERRTNPTAEINQATLSAILARFGFLNPSKIVNQPIIPSEFPETLPLGVTHGTISPIGGTSILVANLGCSSCHAGVTYAADGAPQADTVMLGMPNSSLNLEAYTQAIFVAMRRFSDAPDLLDTANKLFPNMTLSERLSLRWIVLPLAKKRLAELANVDRPLPFPNGSPGSTNGVAALKYALGTPLIEGGRADAGVVSIPDLTDRVWKTSFLADGAYGVAGKPPQSVMTSQDVAKPEHLTALAMITTFFTVPSMGVHPDKARDGLKDVNDIMSFLMDNRTQAFPGTVDPTRAARGAGIYQANCSSCHGTYDQAATSPRLVSYPNWIGDVGTDSLRSRAFDQKLADGVADTLYRDDMSVNIGRGYVAPPLSGIWASPPYLHNGSVVSLRALLHPEQRIKRFKTGGHALDFDAVGIKVEANGDYPAGYRAFSTPAWVDTDEAGRSSGGHLYGRDLSLTDKAALIEYLKTL